MTLSLLLQGDMVEGEPIELWWLWFLIAALCLGLAIYLMRHIKPGGPWWNR